MKEVKILGAGISGLSAAINLAKKGYDTTVFDRAKDSGQRFSGDLQGFENWTSKTDTLRDIRQMNIHTNFKYTPFYRGIITDGTEEVELKFKKPITYMIKRGTMQDSLDQNLKWQALDSGVKINFNSKLKESEANIVATGPSLRYMIAADIGISFESEMENVLVFMLNKIGETVGYSYLIVTEGYGVVCSCGASNSTRLKASLDFSLGKFEEKYGLKMKNKRKVGGIASGSFRTRFEEGGRMYVGEACGLQDFLWGFGMRTSMASGYLAARSIDEKTEYEKLMKGKFGDFLKAGVVNRCLWERWSNNYSNLIKIGKRFAAKPEVLRSRIYDYGMVRRLLFPMAKRDMQKKYPKAF